MFVVVVRGRTDEADSLGVQLEAWDRDVKPKADGFLGSTSGVADDGTFVSFARFDSEDAARRLAELPEQGAWWEQTSKLLEDVTSEESGDVVTLRGGGSDEAGFVQVVFGRATDEARVRALDERFASRTDMRPDVLGELIVWFGGGRFAQAVYFRSEAEARAGESAELSAEDRQLMDDWQSAVTEMEFHDLRDPWLVSR